jgi:SAM-dependent methyltransferase
MNMPVQEHYELYPYPHYPLMASVRRSDTCHLNLNALWARFNGMLPPDDDQRILIAGCGSFSPYPFALANPDTDITALDLSARSLRRARLHCLLHRCFNVTFVQGDLQNPAVADGRYGFIDAYGVLHHLQDPAAGLAALAARLTEGGIMRIMLYSRYARRSEESIRRALRLLKITDTATLRPFLKRARPGSRLREYLENAFEARFEAGLADALLHPCVTTYRIDDLLEMASGAGLVPLLFAHHGACEAPEEEIRRIRRLEEEKDSPGNFVLYLGKPSTTSPLTVGDTLVRINPCLRGALGRMRLAPQKLPGRPGQDYCAVNRRERAFLRRFTTPVPLVELTPEEQAMVTVYSKALLLLQYRSV